MADLAIGSWTHIGRVYTNGESFLLLDSDLLSGRRGDEDQFEELLALGAEATTIPVGDGLAGIVGVDGSVNDEGWLEVFRAGDRLAVVQALGDPYEQALHDALNHPESADVDGGVIELSGGELVLCSSAMDGTDADATVALAVPGPTPTEWKPAHLGSQEAHALRIPMPPGGYRLRVRWMTEVADRAAFARWLLEPVMSRTDLPANPPADGCSVEGSGHAGRLASGDA